MVTFFRVVVAMAVVTFCSQWELIAQEEETKPDERTESLSLLTKSMEGFKITTGTDLSLPGLDFNKKPVLRYNDPIATTSFAKVSDGAVFVWTRNGFPEAVSAIHDSKTGRLWVEFLSLSSRPLTATRMGQVYWSPAKNGVDFKPITDAPVPEKDTAKRLTQMRTLSSFFSASISDQDSARQELRLLSRPAFRYSQPDRGILDGAIFIFARSTNPEMLLLLEARVVNQVSIWMYSPARFTGRKADLRYRDKPTWSHDVFPAQRDPTEPFFQMFLVPGT